MGCQQFRQTCVSFNPTWGMAILLIHFVSNIFAFAKVNNCMFYVHMDSCFTLLRQLHIDVTSSTWCHCLILLMSSCSDGYVVKWRKYHSWLSFVCILFFFRKQGPSKIKLPTSFSSRQVAHTLCLDQLLCCTHKLLISLCTLIQKNLASVWHWNMLLATFGAHILLGTVILMTPATVHLYPGTT
jgi:hypothetical protein